jgi:phage-related protein
LRVKNTIATPECTPVPQTEAATVVTGIAGSAKPLHWIGSSREDLRVFPKDVRRVMGQALFEAQRGTKHPDAKPMKGFGGAGVLEVVECDDGNTYRAVYTVRFAGVIYVLHTFQKRSKRGIATPRRDIDMIRSRLRRAQEHYARATGRKP